MAEVHDLKHGDKFRFSKDRITDVFEFVRNVFETKAGESTLKNCRIVRVMFYMDGVWHPDTAGFEQNCNPYADVTLVTVKVKVEDI